MNCSHLLLAPVLTLVLGACAVDTPATRDTPVQVAAFVPVARSAPGIPADVVVRVPASLKVSEANRFYPIADIVWRGDPPGDRRAQVAALFAEAIEAASLASGVPAAGVEVDVRRFHSLTEKTRYTVGGVHSIRFDLTLRDPASGVILDGPRRVVADVRGSGGAQAIEDDRIGRTQRVVVVERLTQVFTRELAAAPLPAGAGAPVSIDPVPADLVPVDPVLDPS